MCQFAFITQHECAPRVYLVSALRSAAALDNNSNKQHTRESWHYSVQVLHCPSFAVKTSILTNVRYSHALFWCVRTSRVANILCEERERERSIWLRCDRERFRSERWEYRDSQMKYVMSDCFSVTFHFQHCFSYQLSYISYRQRSLSIAFIRPHLFFSLFALALMIINNMSYFCSD